jgi:hypothetical protein
MLDNGLKIKVMFNLAEFYTLAMNLDLSILTTDEVEATVRILSY